MKVWVVMWRSPFGDHVLCVRSDAEKAKECVDAYPYNRWMQEFTVDDPLFASVIHK